MPERAPWDHYAQACPECEDGLLEPERESLGDTDSNLVICIDCETEFSLLPIPRGRPTGQGCPDCGGDLQMAEIHYSECTDCGEQWTIEEVSWYRRFDDN